MPQVDLSTLSGPELRRLLDTTRQRGEASLSYQILQEMAARREGRKRRGVSPMRRPAEPRIIALDLGDPMEREDELPPLPAWRSPPAESSASASPPPEPEPEPVPRRSRRRKAQPRPIAAPAAAPVAVADLERTPPGLEPKRPRSVWDADPEPPEEEPAKPKGWGLRLRPPGLESLHAPGRLRGGLATGFAVGITAGIALGWWVGGVTREAPSPPIAPIVAPAAAPVQTAALTPRPAPAATPLTPTAAEPEPPPEPRSEAVTEALPEQAFGPSPPDLPEGSQPSPDAAQVAAAEAMELPRSPPARRKPEAVIAAETPRTAPAQAAPAALNACTSEPTPADRTICGDPDLRRLQRELRQAYADALEAHQDRALLRQRQLEWRNARNTVSEPDRLVRLYEQRIRKLNAATAEARQQR